MSPVSQGTCIKLTKWKATLAAAWWMTQTLVSYVHGEKQYSGIFIHYTLTCTRFFPTPSQYLFLLLHWESIQTISSFPKCIPIVYYTSTEPCLCFDTHGITEISIYSIIWHCLFSTGISNRQTSNAGYIITLVSNNSNCCSSYCTILGIATMSNKGKMSSDYTTWKIYLASHLSLPIILYLYIFKGSIAS